MDCWLLALVALPSQAAPAPTELIASDTGAAAVGQTLSASGNFVAVGAPDANLVVLFEHAGAGWVERDTLVGPPLATGTGFGLGLALSGDDLLVGAPDLNNTSGTVGSVYCYAGNGATWSLTGIVDNPLPDLQSFGEAIDVEGDVAVVGGSSKTLLSGYGAAYVLGRAGGSWAIAQKLQNPPPIPPSNNVPYYGRSVALSGDTLVVGASFRALVYVLQAGAWIPQGVLTTPTAGWSLGELVALDGDTALVGEPLAPYMIAFEGRASIFERTNGSWNFTQEFASPKSPPGISGHFGEALSIQGDLAFVGEPFQRFMHVYQRWPGGWTHLLSPGEDNAFPYVTLGTSAELLGSTLLVGDARFSTGVRAVYALAYNPTTGQLLTARDDQIIEVRTYPNSAVVATLPASPDQVEAMTYDANHDEYYLMIGPDLARIDAQSWAILERHAVSFGSVLALAYDAATDTLYGASDATDQLITIDPSTGIGTVVGAFGLDGVNGLAFDGAGTLHCVDRTDLYTVSTGNGEEIYVTTLQENSGGSFEVADIAFDTAQGKLFGVRNTSVHSSTVREYDLATGAVLDDNPLGILDVGAVFAFDLEFSSSYCTAGVTASGCSAALSTSGLASAGAPSGFTLDASAVEGAKNGIYFFGTSGRQANPWGNGSSLQCVTPPVTRAGLLSGSGTSGQCDGFFTQDLNALWCPSCPSPGKNPGVGTWVQAQLWFRDPASSSNQTTSLSNAVEFLVGF